MIFFLVLIGVIVTGAWCCVSLRTSSHTSTKRERAMYVRYNYPYIGFYDAWYVSWSSWHNGTLIRRMQRFGTQQKAAHFYKNLCLTHWVARPHHEEKMD